MNTHRVVTSTLGVLFLLPVVACQQEEAGADGAAAPLPGKRPTDVDLGHGYVRRAGAIHFIGGGTTGTGDNATRIDTPSPELLKKVVDSHFGPFKTAEGLDVASFEALSEKYTRDKDRVYSKVISPGEFLVIQLPEADPESFAVLAPTMARDKNHVWYHERIQPGADPATVEVVNEGFSVFKDKDSVHYQSEQIAGADSASFKHLASGYYADQNQVYWGPEPIPDADPGTFEVLGDSFVAKDRSKVYRSGRIMPVFDVASLELILHDPHGYQILSDRNGIHLNGMTFPRSKPVKTRVIDNLTVEAGDLVLLVSTYHSTPVTVFKEDGRLMAETTHYDPTTREPLGLITAEVTAEGLKAIRTGPLPGKAQAPPVPDWQLEVFKSPHLVQRMIEAGKRIK